MTFSNRSQRAVFFRELSQQMSDDGISVGTASPFDVLQSDDSISAATPNEEANRSTEWERIDRTWDPKERAWIDGKPVKREINESYYFRSVFSWPAVGPSGQIGEPEHQLYILDQGLVEGLRSILPNYDNFVDEVPTFAGRLMYVLLDDIKSAIQNGVTVRNFENEIVGIDHQHRIKFQALVKHMEEEYKPITESLARLPPGQISYKLLWTVFKPGRFLAVRNTSSSDPTAMICRFGSYRLIPVRDRPNIEGFGIDGALIDFDGYGFVQRPTEAVIQSFMGFRDINTLEAYPLSDDLRDTLKERGRLYLTLMGRHHLAHKGSFNGLGSNPSSIREYSRPGATSVFGEFRHDGRVMVDVVAFRKMCGASSAQFQGVIRVPATELAKQTFATTQVEFDGESDRMPRSNWVLSRRLASIPPTRPVLPPFDNFDTPGQLQPRIDEKEVPIPESFEVPEHQLFLLPAYVYGFSFKNKAWGQMLIEDIRPIEFKKDAFKRLVLNEKVKDLVKALATASTSANRDKGKILTDVIEGKDGGAIILLYGPPGCGKTLTAEATAELLEKPLYPLTSGDLGVHAEHVEVALGNAFELAKMWDAVLLLDEADVFLETRNTDIYRNALTSVFLRMLEHHKGLLILTTNRVQDFDAAMYSRFSVILRYEGLTPERRAQVWVSLLTEAKVSTGDEAPEGKSFISTRDINAFSRLELNGRVIKRIIQTAQALALSQQKPLRWEHIHSVLEVQQIIPPLEPAIAIEYPLPRPPPHEVPLAPRAPRFAQAPPHVTQLMHYGG